MTKTMRGAEVPGTPIQTFKLHVERGQFTDSEIVVMLGEFNMFSCSLSVCY
jgi:translation initiation factor RLI1